MDRIRGEAGLDDLGYTLRAGHDPLSTHRYETGYPISVDTQHMWAVPDQDGAPGGWDPAEELAEMLAGAARTQTVSGPMTGPMTSPLNGSLHSPLNSPLNSPLTSPYNGPLTGPLNTPLSGSLNGSLNGPLNGRPRRRRSRRRLPPDSHFLDGGRRVTHITLLIAAITVSSVAMLGWSIAYSYDQLRGVASSVLPGRMAVWWPLTVFGPWFVAALSILRATIQHRSAVRSWAVILTASAMAMALCVAHTSHTLLSLVIIGIPPVTALVCFWELIGQVPSPVRPKHAAPSTGPGRTRRSHGLH